MTKIRTAILPVAGQGTRLLPLTKAVPKELLPVYDIPLLQFAIDEALSAGAERIVMVNHPSKKIIERHVQQDGKLLESLRRKGKDDLAEAVEQTTLDDGVDVRFVYQEEQRGLGHAVNCAASEVLPGPVAVILPDDLIVECNCMEEMAASYDASRAALMIAAMEVPGADISKYGAFNVTAEEGRTVTASGLVEKPAPEEAPSHYAAVGRYILPQEIFAELSRTAPGHGNEIQLTDAIAALIPQMGLSGYRFSGKRFDCGHHEGLLAASNWRRGESATLGVTALAAE